MLQTWLDLDRSPEIHLYALSQPSGCRRLVEEGSTSSKAEHLSQRHTHVEDTRTYMQRTLTWPVTKTAAPTHKAHVKHEHRQVSSSSSAGRDQRSLAQAHTRHSPGSQTRTYSQVPLSTSMAPLSTQHPCPGASPSYPPTGPRLTSWTSSALTANMQHWHTPPTGTHEYPKSLCCSPFPFTKGKFGVTKFRLALSKAGVS